MVGPQVNVRYIYIHCAVVAESNSRRFFITTSEEQRNPEGCSRTMFAPIGETPAEMRAAALEQARRP
jgi:hypothetical protein